MLLRWKREPLLFMNQCENTKSCAATLAGDDPKKEMLLEIMDHSGFAFFCQSQLVYKAFHGKSFEELAYIWKNTPESDKAYFIVYSTDPNPYYEIQESYKQFLKGRYAAHIEQIAKADIGSEEQETSKATDFRSTLRYNEPPCCEGGAEISGEVCCGEVRPSKSAEAIQPKEQNCCTKPDTEIPEAVRRIKNYRPVLDSLSGKISPTFFELMDNHRLKLQEIMHMLDAYRARHTHFTPAVQRCISLALTKIDEAILWYEKANEVFDDYSLTSGVPTTAEAIKTETLKDLR